MAGSYSAIRGSCRSQKANMPLPAGVVEEVLGPAPGLVGRRGLDPRQLEAHGLGVEAVGGVQVPGGDGDVVESHPARIARRACPSLREGRGLPSSDGSAPLLAAGRRRPGRPPRPHRPGVRAAATTSTIDPEPQDVPRLFLDAWARSREVTFRSVADFTRTSNSTGAVLDLPADHRPAPARPALHRQHRGQRTGRRPAAALHLPRRALLAGLPGGRGPSAPSSPGDRAPARRPWPATSRARTRSTPPPRRRAPRPATASSWP